MLASLVAVYAAPNAHVAWRRGGPVVVLGGFALLFLSDVAIELLGQQ